MMNEETPPRELTSSEGESWRKRFLVGMAISLVVAIVAIYYGPSLWALTQSESELASFVRAMGPWGPLAVIVLNAVQIVVAPVPGYVMQAVAGFLFGPWWGGLWGAIGLFLGAMVAMALARRFGRPLVERLAGAGRLERWESVIHSDSSLVWFVLLLTPTGDLPYFLAGLSHVSFRKIALLTLVIRAPSAFVVAAAAGGALQLPPLFLFILFGGLGLLLLLFMRYQEQIQQWIDLRVSRRVDFRPHSHAELRSTEPKPLAARPAPIIPSQETSP